jgi:glucokinase
MIQLALGIDIGGTNTRWGLVNQKGTVLLEGNLPTKNYPSAQTLAEATAQIIKAELTNYPEYTLIGIGIGAPNGNYFNGTIEHTPNLDWKGIVPLQELFEAHFAVPIAVTNDANAAAMGEMLFGVAKGLKDFVVITLGTGLGSGFVVNGKVLYGHDAFAGELGHTIIELAGRECGCGRQGCLETYVSATGIVRTARLFLDQNQSSNTLLKNDDSLTGKLITEAAQKGDVLALAIFDFTAQKLGLSIANMVAITSPSAVVLFGGLAQSGDLLAAPTKRYMEAYMLNIFKEKVQLLSSAVPQNHAAVLGASALGFKAAY